MGPPGTGKTHTIANLIGDLLAQGKTVLVSSQKEKALRVLKSMLPQPLQDLCVSITNERDDVLATVQALTDRLALIRCDDLERDIAAEEKSRAALLEELAGVRRRLFAEICREFTPVSLCGKDWTPSSLGKWLAAHGDLASVLPDQDIAEGPFPFTDEELRELYALMRTTPGNAGALLEDGSDVLGELPEPADQARLFAEVHDIRAYLARCGVEVEALPAAGGLRRIRYRAGGLEVEAQSGRDGPLASLAPLIEKDLVLGMPEPWVLAARAAGAAGGAIAGRWEKLAAALAGAAALSEKEIGQMDELSVQIEPSADRAALREALCHFRDNRIYGEPGFLTKLTQKSRLAALATCRVNGAVPNSEHAFGAVLLRMELEDAREALRRLWESLVTAAGGPAFESLGDDHPEAQIKLRYGPRLEKALCWWKECAEPLLEGLRGIGVRTELLTGGADAGPLEACEALSRNVEEFLRPAVAADRVQARLSVLEAGLARAEKAAARIRSASPALGDALLAGLRHSPADYEAAWKQASTLKLGMPSLRRREELLLRIDGAAPLWAEAMREGRPDAFPANAREAWDWQQLDHWFKGYLGTDFGELQKKAQGLSERLSAETVRLSADRAWLALARRMQGNRSLMQKLQGWAQIATRIGRGTGRAVESLRAQARDLMRACSQAVPCWIMPAESALSTFDGSWKFSVVVIDEASQSDIVSMPILFLGEKAVIAGDDRQVSPAAVGVGESAVTALSRQYIQGRIANWAIYQAQSSLYDLAKTAYAPQMLREHFRCVPPIIGYSNALSYGGAILPLRDAASTNLLPPVVLCRVKGSRAANDTNLAEAEAIAGRIKACLARPEYRDKTFGVIVMRSGRTGAQIGLINNLIYRAVGPEAIERHKILCGLSPDFQGDERDVIFLSLVDSPDGDKPLRRETAGQDDGMKKRWNVAVSRARDQVWAVYSFDADTQLQEGDIRKTFFDYLKEPTAVPGASAAAFEMPEFAEDVAQALERRSYTVIRGYKAGAFTLPLVVEGSGFKAVLECDGELQSPDAQRVVDEMERQAILERAGWKFARVRGGEWYRDPQSALWWLVSDLEDLGVKAPGSGEPTGLDGRLTEAVQTEAKSYEERLHETLATADSDRERRERIIAELRKLEREVDDEVRKGSAQRPS